MGNPILKRTDAKMALTILEFQGRPVAASETSVLFDTLKTPYYSSDVLHGAASILSERKTYEMSRRRESVLLHQTCKLLRLSRGKFLCSSLNRQVIATDVVCLKGVQIYSHFRLGHLDGINNHS